MVNLALHILAALAVVAGAIGLAPRRRVVLRLVRYRDDNPWPSAPAHAAERRPYDREVDA